MKGDLVIGQRDEAIVGDGHAMGVAAEILEHVLGAAEGWFAVDHPRLAKQWSEPGGEGLGLSQEGQLPAEAELVVLEGGPEAGDELATKAAPQHRAGKKEARAGWNPAGVVERESAGRDDTVDMGMKLELLIPGVQHAEEADFGAEMSGIAGDFEKRFCTGPEQEIVDDLFVLQGQGRQLRRQSEDDMDVGRGEKFAAPGLEPAFAGTGLTLWAMPVSAAVVRDVARCPQRVHSSIWPPSAAVRHRAMASRTLMCGQRIHWRLRSMKAVPAARTRSATSKGGRLIYSSSCDLPFSWSESRGLAVA